MGAFKDSRWKEILDGKREWFAQGHTHPACDLFEVQVVHPLRQLQDEGRIDIEEISASVPGRYRVVEVLLREILKYDDE
jgi:hypothetical protein